MKKISNIWYRRELLIFDVICVKEDTKLGGNDTDIKLYEHRKKNKRNGKCEFVKKNLINQEKRVFNFQNFY